MFIDKVITLALGAMFLLALSCEGPTAEEATTNNAPQKRTLQQEPTFWDYAASSNMLQVAIATVAAEKGTTEHIRNIASEAVAFHVKALEDLKALAERYDNIQLPDSLGAADLGLVLEFKLLEGEELDTHFREFVLSTHNAQLDTYEEAFLKADDTPTRDWLMDMRAHLRQEITAIAEADSVETAAE
ncbi:DUF4142 domain-containing protein [Pontibacter anaerobius]|uniref:DUF4142 domain-containing protein n=1 Tax=Pontibacter anaerobius TaxID=2993940 RepID=A0ABT3RIX1_9BACT|nr:DUF4142 domain-containing protein [Pontibacter anaerobius]MCX2741292.1 DUF4142 domain-containing protein [Pontibacter anaerobius]